MWVEEYIFGKVDGRGAPFVDLVTMLFKPKDLFGDVIRLLKQWFTI